MTDRPVPQKRADASRTIGEVAGELELPQHVLRFWETRFPQLKPSKGAGGRRNYGPEDVALLRAVQVLLYDEGYTIKGVQRLLAEFGARHVADALARSTIPAVEGRREASDDGQEANPMPNDEGPSRRSVLPVPPGATTARTPPRAEHRRDLVRQLEAVLADLAECEKLLTAVRST